MRGGWSFGHAHFNAGVHSKKIMVEEDKGREKGGERGVGVFKEEWE